MFRTFSTTPPHPHPPLHITMKDNWTNLFFLAKTNQLHCDISFMFGHSMEHSSPGRQVHLDTLNAMFADSLLCKITIFNMPSCNYTVTRYDDKIYFPFSMSLIGKTIKDSYNISKLLLSDGENQWGKTVCLSFFVLNKLWSSLIQFFVFEKSAWGPL